MENQPIGTELDEALAGWEAGDLSRGELTRRFPDEDVAGILSMFEELRIVATGSTPDPAGMWRAVREGLPPRRRGDDPTLIVLPQEAVNPPGEEAESRR